MQAEYEKRPDSQLDTVITIMSRPVRIVKGQSIHQAVDESLFSLGEERELYAAAESAALKMDKSMSVPAFLEVSLWGKFARLAVW